MSAILSLVIPCHNEAEAIPSVMANIKKAIPSLIQEGISDVEIIVVDDCSTDNSCRILSSFPNVKMIRNQKRLGYGHSLKRGFHQAEGEWIGFFDMDNTYDPMDFVSLFRRLKTGQASLICGNRMGNPANMPKIREVGNRLFSFVINKLFNEKVNDSCTGLRLFHRSQKDFLCALKTRSLNFSLAMTLAYLTQKLPFEEIPISYKDRLGSSKLSVLTDGPRFLLLIFNTWIFFRLRQVYR